MDGAPGLDGAARLQWLHPARSAMMAWVMPDHNTDALALEIIDVTPGFAASRVANTSSLREGV